VSPAMTFIQSGMLSPAVLPVFALQGEFSH
jgi:hypothetical protein